MLHLQIQRYLDWYQGQVNMSLIKYGLGITKAYSTRVGHGPFPSELKDDLGKKIGEIGGEIGATTGRTRRCGWLDLRF